MRLGYQVQRECKVLLAGFGKTIMAGGVGLEPTVRVLETRGLPINRPSSMLLLYFTLT